MYTTVNFKIQLNSTDHSISIKIFFVDNDIPAICNPLFIKPILCEFENECYVIMKLFYF